MNQKNPPTKFCVHDNKYGKKKKKKSLKNPFIVLLFWFQFFLFRLHIVMNQLPSQVGCPFTVSPILDFVSVHEIISNGMKTNKQTNFILKKRPDTVPHY